MVDHPRHRRAVGGDVRYFAVATDNDGASSGRASTTNAVRDVVVVPPTVGVAFTLLDAMADTRLRPLMDGDVLTQAEVPSNFSMQAEFADAVGGAELVLTGPGGLRHVSMEFISAYTLFENQDADYAGSQDVLGERLAAIRRPAGRRRPSPAGM